MLKEFRSKRILIVVLAFFLAFAQAASAEELYAGKVSAYSSPEGAAFIVDGEFIGLTPVNTTDIPVGSHQFSLTMSSYYDYDTQVWLDEDEEYNFFGVLHPIGAVAATTTSGPSTASSAPVATATAGTGHGILENPAIIVAIIGVVTASIGGAASIYSAKLKTKKE